MDGYKCIVPLRYAGTVNSRRVTSPLVSTELAIETSFRTPRFHMIGFSSSWRVPRKNGNRQQANASTNIIFRCIGLCLFSRYIEYVYVPRYNNRS
ncbi:hypothetical protein TNCV_3450911 [Trichonephila clavipes]|uniref:Uncharacterized protein n=1 Tax=Trichonephila clavipes TaxID=2585209 RepID=A0A8X6WJQ2_TRICX|nr:hypothetical protein TNCV_3450911 [Trichonephila clavipes]